MVSCIPSVLDKYQNKNTSMMVDASTPNPSGPAKIKAIKEAVVKVRENTYKVPVPFNKAFSSVLEVLVHNYIFKFVDARTGVITTGFDKFYKTNQLFRNQVTVLLKAIDNNSTQLILYNNIEILESQTVSDDKSFIWIPHTKRSQEVDRVVKNLARLLGLNLVSSTL